MYFNRLLSALLVLLSLSPSFGQQNVRQLLLAAGRARAEGQYAEAVRLYQEALPRCSGPTETAQAWLGLANAYRQQGHIPQAIKALGQVTRLTSITKPLCIAAWRQLAGLYYEEGEADQAKAAWEGLLRAFPDDDELQSEVILELARLAMDEGVPAAAVERLQRLLTTQPKPPHALQLWMTLVQAQLTAEDFTGAVASARAGWQILPDQTEIIRVALEGLSACGRTGAAIALAWEIVAAAPDDNELFGLLLSLHQADNSLDQLALWLEQQTDDPAREALWLRRLAQVRVQTGDDILALKAYQRLTELHPDDRNILREAGEAALRAGELTQGEQWLHQGLKLAPADTGVVLSLGEVYLRQGRPEAALRFWKEGLQYHPDDRPAVLRLGNALQRHQLYHEALGVYTEARQALGDPRAFSAQVGQIHEALLDFTAATREYVATLTTPAPYGPGAAGMRLQDLIEDAAARPEVCAALTELSVHGPLPPEAEALIFYARVLDGKNPDAILAALPTDTDPTTQGLIASLAYRLEKAGHWHPAALAYGRLRPAQEAPADRAALTLRISSLLHRAGDWRAALQAFAATPAENLPGELSRRLVWEQAQLLLREARQPAEARELLSSLATGDDALAWSARWSLADCAFALGEYTTARTAYEALSNTAPLEDTFPALPPLVIGNTYLPSDEEDPPPWHAPGEDYVAFQKAEMLLREGQYREAGAAYRDLSKRHPDSPQANDALERVLLIPALERQLPGAEAYVEAIKAFDRGESDLAVDLLSHVPASPLAESARLLLADVQLWQDNHVAALVTLEGLAADFPESPLAATALLRLAGLLASDDPAGARAKLQTVLLRFADAPQAAEARILLQALAQPAKERQP